MPSLHLGLSGPVAKEHPPGVLRDEGIIRFGRIIGHPIHIPGDAIWRPFERIEVRRGRGVEREVEYGVLAPLSVPPVIELDLGRILAQELDVDFVVRVAVIGAGIGEEGRDKS